MRPTWLSLIQSSLPTSNARDIYFNHISTAGNANNKIKLQINSKLETTIFWKTLSLTFGIQIHIYHITNSSSILECINDRKLLSAPAKIVNHRISPDNTAIWEPWINPECTKHNKTKVCYLYVNDNNFNLLFS